jgi:hypothetical protein
VPSPRTRRRVLAGAAATLLPAAGCAGAGQYGNVQVANRTGRELWLRLVVRSQGGLLADPETVYEDAFRQPPTRGSRTTLADVAPPGRYRVRVVVGTDDPPEGPAHETGWRHDGDPGGSLIVGIEAPDEVEFLTQ